jgi:hypothetical protein
MSGGAFDYKCHQVMEFAIDLEAKLREPRYNGIKNEWEQTFTIPKKLRKKIEKFVERLKKDANICHGIEWYFSGDYGDETLEETFKNNK